MRALRRYRRFLLLLVCGTVAVAVAGNTWINPWRVTPWPWSSRAMEPYRAIETTWNRTAKAGLVRSGAWDAAMFGSSRVDIALDPAHPLFAGLRCANLGLNAAGLGESHAIFRYFIERENPRLVVFALDPGDLTTPLPPFYLSDFALSPLDEAAGGFERELRYHAGISTLAASAATAARALRGEPAEHTPAGFRRETPYPEDQRQLVATLYLATTTRMARYRIDHDRVDEGKMALMEDIAARCRARGTRLVLLLTPNHALFQLAFRELGDPDAFFARDRAALAAVAARANAASADGPPVEVWDFLDGHPLNAGPLPPPGVRGAHIEGWIDLFHAAPEVGNRMLDRIAGGGGGYGERLTPENAAARAEAAREGLEAYAARHPADLAFLRESLARFSSAPQR
jgi:hypothetical protein